MIINKLAAILVLLLALTALSLFAMGKLSYVEAEQPTISCQNYKFYIYGQAGCPACSETKKILCSLCGEETIVFKDFTVNESYVHDIVNLYEVLNLGDNYYIPLTIVFSDNHPIISCVGYRDAEAWELMFQISKDVEGLLVVDNNGNVKIITDEEVIKKVTKIVLGREIVEVSETLSFGEALPVIIGTALADSVNPCTFSVFSALLLIAFSRKQKLLFTGLAFIFAIYAMYFAMGLGLIKIFYYISFIKYIIVILALFFGISAVISGLKGFKSPIPSKFKEVIESRIEKAVNPLSAAIAGVIVSVTLLPCTSGPYFVATATLSKLNSFTEAMILLMLYNLIFIAPLIFILVALLTLSLTTRQLKEWRTKKLDILELISGILLIFIALYMLFFLEY